MTKAKRKEDLIKRPLTAEEDEALQVGYGHLPSISNLVPGRSSKSIIVRAWELGLKRPQHRPHPGRVVSPVFVRDGVEGKACVHCLEWKPLVKFSRHSTCVGGRRNICTTCEGRVATSNPEIHERRLAANRRYHARIPDQLRINNERRRCRMAGGRGVSLEAYRELLEFYDGRCAYCGAPADTMDHFIPLARGGEHDIDNVIPACRACNSQKHTMTGFEYKVYRAKRSAGKCT